MDSAITFIWKLSVLAELSVAVRLLLQGLGGEYPALLTACCILPIKSLLLMFSYSGPSNALMRQFWKAAEPIEWVLSAWIVFELFSRWTRSYKGIGRFGKLLLAVLLLGALVLSMAFCPMEWKALVFAGDTRIYYILHRIVWGTLAIFVISTWLFFRNYPVAIAPNVIRHNHVAAVYFALGALSSWAFTLNGLKVIAWVNLSMVAISLACYLAWAIRLTRKGRIPIMPPHVTIEDKARIERVNQELLGFMRRFPG